MQKTGNMLRQSDMATKGSQPMATADVIIKKGLTMMVDSICLFLCSDRATAPDNIVAITPRVIQMHQINGLILSVLRNAIDKVLTEFEAETHVPKVSRKMQLMDISITSI